MEKKMNNKGFSLVELIVVIAIMAVLVGVLAPQFIKYVEKSRQSTDITNLDSIKTVVETYYADKDNVPATVTISVSNNAFSISAKDGSGNTMPTTDLANEGGVANAKSKGKWDKQPLSATWAVSTNTWTYQGESKYYTAGSGNSIVAK